MTHAKSFGAHAGSAAICRSWSAIFALVAAALAALLNGCGSGESERAEIDLNGHSVVWAGPANADQGMKQEFDATRACLLANELRIRKGYADVVVIDGQFRCNGVLARGCTELNGGFIYIDREYLYSDVFSHEVIHWETGMDDAYHKTAVFNLCLEPG